MCVKNPWNAECLQRFRGFLLVSLFILQSYLNSGVRSSMIPQIIKAGEKIGTVILEDGKEEPIIAEEDITIEAGTPVAVKMYARRGIIDERTPLFR